MNDSLSGHKRLFLFAFYSRTGLVGRATFNYLRALSMAGDVVFFADCGMEDGELRKIRETTVHAGALRHGEYDFGSYKRGWEWAVANRDIRSYDYVYLVNDSVFPTSDNLVPIIQRMECDGDDFIGMVFNPSRRGPHIQSWFAGLSRNLFTGTEFSDFIYGVCKEKDKGMICERYETGLSRLALSAGCEPYALFTIRGKGIYNDVLRNLRKGLPFIKKSSFIRHNCSLAASINKALAEMPHNIADAIYDEVRQEYGTTIYERIKSASRVGCACRKASYLLNKLRQPFQNSFRIFRFIGGSPV